MSMVLAGVVASAVPLQAEAQEEAEEAPPDSGSMRYEAPGLGGESESMPDLAELKGPGPRRVIRRS